MGDCKGTGKCFRVSIHPEIFYRLGKFKRFSFYKNIVHNESFKSVELDFGDI